jgi:4'-phosphopantetheinyl transferase EntD
VTPLGAAVAQLAARAGVTAALAPVDGPGRLAQRAAGAHAAATALTAAGCAGGTVRGHADDGRPLWPEPFTGSIAHTDDDAIAAICRQGPSCTALGVDIELSGALGAADAQLVLDRREREVVGHGNRADWTATLIWSAKESAFKAWSTATAGGLDTVDPADIHVELDEDARTFTVEASGQLGKAVRPCGDVVGAYTEAEGRIVTMVVLRPGGSG